MHADPKGVLTGVHFLDGDHACCEGTLAAGARFAAGYPITPSTEVVERFASRIPTVGGIFIQMEDELAASIAIQGAVWGGAKAFTVTSGPGFSLMMEHIGYAAMTETPCVFVNVQRGGPSTGLPTLPAQADMMQARWGSHGDYGIIALCPNSPQECFDLTITASTCPKNSAYPVMMMLDECVGHMTEKVVIPEAGRDRASTPRRFTKLPPHEFRLFEPQADQVPDMVKAGEGYRFHVTGSDARRARLSQHEHGNAGPHGAPAGRQTEAAGRSAGAVRSGKPGGCRGGGGVLRHHLARGAAGHPDGARAAASAPASSASFPPGRSPNRTSASWPAACKAFVVPELNLGQMVHEVARAAEGRRSQGDSGEPCRRQRARPEVILNAIVEAAR